MDPYKVDALLKWKVLTNCELLRGFLGATSYLADDIDCVHIPMGVLHTCDVNYRNHTIQIGIHAPESVRGGQKTLPTNAATTIDHSPSAPPINLVTDDCAMGIAGVISQGEN